MDGRLNFDEAVVSRRKILDYLLCPEHPAGAAKARFFTAAGYERIEWTRLRNDLIIVGRSGVVSQQMHSRHGTKWIVDGVVNSPCGRAVRPRTVWMSTGSGTGPRLVTAYPR